MPEPIQSHQLHRTQPEEEPRKLVMGKGQLPEPAAVDDGVKLKPVPQALVVEEVLVYPFIFCPFLLYVSRTHSVCLFLCGKHTHTAPFVSFVTHTHAQ